ncbi:MAG: hypothetical protein COA42_11765 [Alteromonadaceae bacterium]|nr:MAG: hypothetical protein COA42_11765 [Alteromonadaceae bacterium]
MISDFETRLATLLGTQLPLPFTGTVARAADNDTAHGSEPRIYLGAYKIDAEPKGFGGNRSVEAPGVSDRIRVLSATVYVNINVLPANNEDRRQQLQGIEQLRYLLDDESFQTGAALIDTGDQGFRIDRMGVLDSVIDVSNAPNSDRPPGITLVAEGVFWPIGVSGETGVVIDEMRIRGVLVDLQLGSPLPAISAGGSAINIEVRVPKLSAHRLGGDGSSLDFNRIAIDLIQAGGQAGTGSLAGGSAGTGSVRLIDIVSDTAAFSYTPPAEPITEFLQVGYEDGENGLGKVIKQFRLEVG